LPYLQSFFNTATKKAKTHNILYNLTFRDLWAGTLGKEIIMVDRQSEAMGIGVTA